MTKGPAKISVLERKKRRISFAYSMPAILLSSMIIIYPLINILYLSFKNIKFFGAVNIPSGFTLNNYKLVLNSSHFWNAMGRTIAYTLIGVSIAFLLGLGLALLLNLKMRFQRLFRLLMLLAWPIPGAVVSILFMWMFDANFGIVNSMLRNAGIISQNVAWLSNSSTAFPAVVTATVWKGYPFFTLMLLAGLQSIPVELYESAKIDGANAIRCFRHITFPALEQVMAISLLLNGLWIFRNYDLIYVMTGGGPNPSTETLPLLLYNEAFKFSRLGSGAVIGVLGLIVCITLVLLSMPALKKQFY